MSSYGIDLQPQDTFSDLIEAILVNNPNLYRLRISSLEISQIDDKFLELLANYSNLADHLHIPLQSGSEAVVKRMNRKYDIDGFVDKVSKIRKIRPFFLKHTIFVKIFVLAKFMFSHTRLEMELWLQNSKIKFRLLLKKNVLIGY